MTTAGVVVLLAVVAPFTRSRERDEALPLSSGPAYLLYALIGVNLGVLTIGVAVAATATFFG